MNFVEVLLANPCQEGSNEKVQRGPSPYELKYLSLHLLIWVPRGRVWSSWPSCVRSWGVDFSEVHFWWAFWVPDTRERAAIPQFLCFLWSHGLLKSRVCTTKYEATGFTLIPIQFLFYKLEGLKFVGISHPCAHTCIHTNTGIWIVSALLSALICHLTFSHTSQRWVIDACTWMEPFFILSNLSHCNKEGTRFCFLVWVFSLLLTFVVSSSFNTEKQAYWSEL